MTIFIFADQLYVACCRYETRVQSQKVYSGHLSQMSRKLLRHLMKFPRITLHLYYIIIISVTLNGLKSTPIRLLPLFLGQYFMQ